MEDGKRRLGVGEDVAAGGLDQADVLEAVLPLLLEPGQHEGAAGKRLQRNRLRDLGTAQLGPHDETRNARVARQHRPAWAVHGPVTGPYPGPFTDVDRLVGVGGLGVGIEGQAAALDQ